MKREQIRIPVRFDATGHIRAYEMANVLLDRVPRRALVLVLAHLIQMAWGRSCSLYRDPKRSMVQDMNDSIVAPVEFVLEGEDQ